jgi:hypothetical protein
MKSLQTISKIMFTAFLFTALNLSTQAQKLKSVQEASVWAPANVKVDGKLKEWDDSFQAYNKTTDVFYTIANDDQNLYFVIKSTLPMNNNKIMAGGMDFTINTAGKKSEKDAYKIIFPLIDMSSFRNQMMSARPGGGGGGGAQNVTVMRVGGGGTFVSSGPMPPGVGGPPDSTAIAAMRKRALGNIKEIKLLGFAAADIPDSVISIYNEYGVKAAVDYDAKGNLTCEIAVPLKYLRLATDGPKEFAYNIKLNGLNLSSMLPPGMPMPMPGGGGGVADVVVVGRSANGGGGGDMPRGMPSMNDMQSMISPTDFWGKYILAKK